MATLERKFVEKNFQKSPKMANLLNMLQFSIKVQL